MSDEVTDSGERVRLSGPYKHGQKWRVHARLDGESFHRSFDTFSDAAAHMLANQAPKPERKRRGASWLYFIQCQDGNGYIKIGYSRDSGERLGDLQMGCPYELVLLGEFRTPEPTLFEAEIHEKFQHLSVRGEWFRPGQDLLDLIGQLPSRAELVQSVLGAAPPASTDPTKGPTTA